MSKPIEAILGECRAQGRSVLTEEESRSILRTLGIPIVAGSAAASADEAVAIAEDIGYPVVMKILSPDVPHKTDAGGVRLGLTSSEQVREAWSGIMTSVRRAVPNAVIQGMSVQQQAKDGIQIILGGLRDAHFGPVVMFGLGGIYAETFGDVAFRMAPLTEDEARKMVSSTKASRILSGLRGQKPVDMDLLYKALVSLGQALTDWDFLREIEINPMVMWPLSGGVALDALITLM